MRFLLLLLVACAPPRFAQGVRYAAVATGRVSTPFMVGEWKVILTEAHLAFGPMYFCDDPEGKDCGESIAELTTVTEIDLLSPEPQPLGDVKGFAGAIRSADFDYGISWPQAESAPRPHSTLEHSAHFIGTATKGGAQFGFEINVDATPRARGVHAVLVKGVSADIKDSSQTLTLAFDAQAWWSMVDFDSHDYSSVLTAMTTSALPEITWSAP
jgi:hypothetical protein